jgi:hypothetical protein
LTARSDCRQHAGEDLEPEILVITEPVRATLEHANLVVHALRWEDPRFTKGEAAQTYAGWRTIVENSRVLRAIQVDEGFRLALLGEKGATTH